MGGMTREKRNWRLRKKDHVRENLFLYCWSFGSSTCDELDRTAINFHSFAFPQAKAISVSSFVHPASSGSRSRIHEGEEEKKISERRDNASTIFFPSFPLPLFS